MGEASGVFVVHFKSNQQSILQTYKRIFNGGIYKPPSYNSGSWK